MLITILMFIFSKFFSFIFFVLIWSQNLKAFKLIEIWYIGRLLYAFFDFIVYLFKFFVIHIRSCKFVPKIWSSSNWLKFGTEVDYHMLISTLMFIFSKFFSFIFFGQIRSQILKFFKLTEIWYRGRLPYDYFDFNVYFFKILFIHIVLDKFGPKIWSYLNWLKFGTVVYAHFDFNACFFKFFSFIVFWTNLVPKCEVLQVDWNLVHR